MRRWLLPLVLLLLTVSAATAALRTPQAKGGDEATGSLKVPVLSARRAPGVVANLVSDTRLRAELEAPFANPALGAGRDHSCLAVDQGGRRILDRHGTDRLVPASTMKLVTAQAALTRLGADETFVTEVKAAAPVGPGGVVSGPLWLVGGGDPVLATSDFAITPPNEPQVRTSFEGVADALLASGVRQVTGGIVGDETRYDVQRAVPTWKSTYLTSGQIGPISAMNVNHGFAPLGPAASFAAQPDVLAAGALTNLLRARGVVVAGAPAEGAAPPEAVVVARVPSPPLHEVLGEMLRHSDNLTAELLVKELGRRFANDGSTAGGVRVVRETLGASGLPVEELTSVDGSGLDRSDLVTCNLLLRVAAAGGPSGTIAADLPVAGRSGTLAQRFVGNPAAGRLRAKTGSLDNVSGLAGYLDSPSGTDHLAFALLANDIPNDGVGKLLQEQVGAILARYPEGPPPGSLAP